MTSRLPYRWRIVALLFLLSALNYLDRQTLSVLAPTLRAELGFSSVQYSYVVAAFLGAYTLGYAFCGRIVDRVGVRRAVAIALSVWSLAGMLHGFAGSWIGLAACRVILGFGESFNTPCGTKAIAEWIPRRERGLSMAVFSNGYIVGAILAPPLVSLVALHFGWKWAFLVTGALGFAFLLLWRRVYRSPDTHPALPEAERAYILSERPPTAAAGRLPLLAALRHPLCLGFLFARLLTDSLSYFFSFWLPAYLESERGFSLAMIGLFGWIPFLAADLGGPGGGALSDWLVRRGWSPVAARRRMLLTAACLMPAALVAVHAPSAWVALGLIAVVLAGQSCWNSNLLTMMVEVFPREHLATYVALASIGGSIGGILSTLLAGELIQFAGYVPVFTGLGFLHLAAFAIILWFMNRARTAQAL